MARSGEAHPNSCRRTKQASAQLCRIGEGADAIARIPLGERPAIVARPVERSVAPLREDDDDGT